LLAKTALFGDFIFKFIGNMQILPINLKMNSHKNHQFFQAKQVMQQV